MERNFFYSRDSAQVFLHYCVENYIFCTHKGYMYYMPRRKFNPKPKLEKFPCSYSDFTVFDERYSLLFKYYYGQTQGGGEELGTEDQLE